MNQSLELNDSQRLEIEQLAGNFFTADEIVLILGLDVHVFFGERLHAFDFNIPFQRGRLLKEADVRKSIINLAVNGSSPAQILAMQIIEKSALNNIPI